MGERAHAKKVPRYVRSGHPQKKFKVSKFSLIFLMILVLISIFLRLVSPTPYPPYSTASLFFVFCVWLSMFLAERSRVNRRMAVYSALIFLLLGFSLFMYDQFLYDIHRSRSPLESLIALIVIAPASLIIIKNLIEIYRGVSVNKDFHDANRET